MSSEEVGLGAEVVEELVEELELDRGLLECERRYSGVYIHYFS